MVRILSEEDVSDVLDLNALLSVIKEAVTKQGRGAVERPARPHFPIGVGLEDEQPKGTGLTMPAYVHGREYYATKIASVHPDNPERGLPTVNAQVTLTDAATGRPIAYMAGTHITNARTGCIGGLSARALTEPPVTLALVGAGTQARWQARAIAAATDVREIRVYSPSDSKHDCATDLEAELDVPAMVTDSAGEAARGADVVVTATTSTEPVVPTAALAPEGVVVAVGAYTAEMQELEPETLTGANAVYADVPAEATETGDALAAGVREEELCALSTALAEPLNEGRYVVLSVGSAVFDAAAVEHIYERAVKEDVGEDVAL